MLTGDELDEADLRGTERAGKQIGVMPESLASQLMGMADRNEPADNEAEGQRFRGFAPGTLVRYGVVAWSYEIDCTDENKAYLDARTRNWAARVIYDMNVRPLGEAESSGPSSGQPAESLGAGLSGIEA